VEQFREQETVTLFIKHAKNLQSEITSEEIMELLAETPDYPYDKINQNRDETH